MPMWNPIGSFGGHLGADVSALVDGQLDHESSERAWAHVAHCPACRRLVEREGWVKRQITMMAARPMPDERPTERLLGSLYDLRPTEHTRPGADPRGEPALPGTSAEGLQAWRDVADLEARGRGRRRATIALAGAGGVSAAVLGISALSGAPLGIGGAAPAGPPAASLTGGTPTQAVVAPGSRVHGRLPGWTVDRDGVAHTVAVDDKH